MTEPRANAPMTEPPPQTDDDRNELLDSLRRERADFLNYKRRMAQERATDREHAQGDVIVRLLPVLDELERAFIQRPQDLESHPWAEGIALLHRELAASLRALGVERTGTVGEEFDPERHDAARYEPRPDTTTWIVDDVERPGYQFKTRQLRPARVSVVGPIEGAAKGASEGANEPRNQPSAGHAAGEHRHDRRSEDNESGA